MILGKSRNPCRVRVVSNSHQALFAYLPEFFLLIIIIHNTRKVRQEGQAAPIKIIRIKLLLVFYSKSSNLQEIKV
jgi:hypothetical protein